MTTLIAVNPCFDKVLTVPRLIPGAFHRATRVSVYAAGKAVNTAMMLTRLGEPARLTGALPEQDGARFLALLHHQAPSLVCDMLKTPGSLRVNTKLADEHTRESTEINEPGEPMPPESAERLLQHIARAASGSEYALLSGSLPRGLDSGFYRRLIAQLQSSGVRCVLDSSGAALAAAVCAAPFLIKPNEEELAALTGMPCDDEAGLLKAARCALDMGARRVLASRGAWGALYVDRNCAWRVPALPVRALYTVGAGDSLSAGLLSGLDHHLPMRAALLRGAIAAAAAVCFGVHEVSSENIRKTEIAAEGLEVRDVDPTCHSSDTSFASD